MYKYYEKKTKLHHWHWWNFSASLQMKEKVPVCRCVEIIRFVSNQRRKKNASASHRTLKCFAKTTCSESLHDVLMGSKKVSEYHFVTGFGPNRIFVANLVCFFFFFYLRRQFT